MKTESKIKKHYRACNLCEAICGLVIEHQNGTILSIKGDPDDPLSKGHICPKAVALQDIYHDSDRLKTPIKRTKDGWADISWQDAYREVGDRINQLQAEHGNDAVALYQGNPSVHNYGILLFSPAFRKALQTKNNYSATSLDQLPHQYVAQLMFGHSFLIPVPDIDRTDFFLIIGANPLVSNGSMMTAPGMVQRMRAVQKRGGKVVVIDPRYTETAKKADQHLFIKPESDVFLLLALLHEIFENQKVDLKQAKAYCQNLDVIREMVLAYPAKKVSEITGIESSTIKTLAAAFADAKTAVCYGRMGVSVQKFGTICQWLINVINLVTGNFDSPGGHMFANPAVKVRRGGGGKSAPRWHSRVSNRPEIIGELPVSVMAEEMTVPGAGKIRGLVVSAGNPVLSAPNGPKLREALEGLEFMVAIDIYLNETTRHADIILPPSTGLETDHYDLVFHALAVRNTAKYSPALFDPDANAQYDWQIFKHLTRLIRKKPSLKDWIMDRWKTPTRLINLGLKLGPYGKSNSLKLSLAKLKKNSHGIDLGPLVPMMPEGLMTAGKKINLAPEVLIQTMRGMQRELDSAKDTNGLRLITRRNLRSNNSWMHNSERMHGGKNRCTLHMNPMDAKQKELNENDTVRVTSKSGAIEVSLEITNDMMAGVVSLPHGWGHAVNGTGLSVASQNPGASINDLTDESRTDQITGNAAFSGVEVEVFLAKTNEN